MPFPARVGRKKKSIFRNFELNLPVFSIKKTSFASSTIHIISLFLWLSLHTLHTSPSAIEPHSLQNLILSFSFLIASESLYACSGLIFKNPDDVEMLQDLIVAAVNEGMKKAQLLMQDKLQGITGGLNIPGMF